MRRKSQEEVAAAARRRLELLGRELDQAGLRRVDDPGERSSDVDRDTADLLPEPSTVAPAGRHARASRAVLTLSYLQDTVNLDVDDDGVGYDGAAR